MPIKIQKLYYGVLPARCRDIVKKYNQDREFAIDIQDFKIEFIIDKLLDGGYGEIVHSFNPQVLCFIPDEIASEIIYYFDRESREQKFKCNPEFMKKLRLMQPGEVVSDSNEFWGKHE